jgi:hypothetical protein
MTPVKNRTGGVFVVRDTVADRLLSTNSRPVAAFRSADESALLSQWL